MKLALKNGSSGNIALTDLMSMARALEVCHTCRVSVTYTPIGTGGGGGAHIVVNAAFDVLPGSDLPKNVTVNADWPSMKARSDVGLVYNLLWQLDYAIGQAYEQMTMKTP